MSATDITKVIDLSKSMAQTKFGALIGVTQSAVSQMLSEGSLPAGASAGEWLLAYCDRLREVASGRMSESGDDGLTAERTRLTKEQADAQQMKNAVTRGELAPVIILEDVLATTAAKAAAVFDAIPGKVRRRLPDLPAAALHLITEEVTKARNIVAAMELPVPTDPDADEEEGEETKE